jgi:apolipoprotein N-acyltransferase
MADKIVRVAGAQLEFPIPTDVISALDKLLATNPSTEVFVLSEYTFDGPVPDKVNAWCREHQRYLIVGGKDDGPDRNYYNTVFVIGPTGEIVFRQAKSVPIQFFKDGLPARGQKLWDSPWGKIGICICYDLSYTRVTDELIRLGAQAIIVPTMDVADWGRRQHELHARVAPVRAAEYGVPIFRLASSGISQMVTGAGEVVASAPFPGQQATINGTLSLGKPGTLPLDRWLAPFATAATGALIVWFVLKRPRGAEAPSTNIQAPEKHQSSNINEQHS